MTKKPRRTPSDTERLDRVLAGIKTDGTDIIVRINRYGFCHEEGHALGNPSVTIYDRADIDAVIRSEKAAMKSTRIRMPRDLESLRLVAEREERRLRHRRGIRKAKRTR